MAIDSLNEANDGVRKLSFPYLNSSGRPSNSAACNAIRFGGPSLSYYADCMRFYI